jgi:zinc and cadmium transporter
MTFTITILMALLGATITTIGIYTINKFSSWGKKNIIYFITFAAGLLISVSLMHLVPESIEMSPRAPMLILGGYFGFYFLNRMIKLFVCNLKKYNSFGIVPALGIGLHSFIDGIIYAVTFNVSVMTGFLATIGLILHEFPEGIVTYLLLIKSGFKERKASFYAFLIAALTTPLGVLVSWPFISNLTHERLGILLSLSAGALIYVGATHLLPEVEKEDKKYTFLALIAGIIVAAIILLVHVH